MQKLKGALAIFGVSKSWEDVGFNNSSVLVLDVAKIYMGRLCMLSPLPVTRSECAAPGN